MSAQIQSAPLSISGHAEVEMTPSVADVCSRILKEGRPTRHIPPCQKYVTIGLFFDGTNNNRLPNIPKITLNVFGFSHGAVEAWAFCYWFSDLLSKTSSNKGKSCVSNIF